MPGFSQTTLNKSKEKWILVGLLWLAFALRALALDDVPPGLRYDELQNHLMAGRVLAGERPLYFGESWGHEPLYHYIQAGTLALFGQSDWSLRLPSIFFGLMEVAGTWLVARKLLGRPTALLAAAFVAVSFWPIFYARIGSRVGSTTAFVVLLLYFLWQSFQSSRHKGNGWLAAVLGGLMLAGGVYVYVAGRIGFGLVALFALYLALFSRRAFKQTWPRFLLLMVVGGVLVWPMFRVLDQAPGLEQRLDLLNQPLAELRQGNVTPVFDLTLRALGMYVVQGEQDWLYNVYGRPIFDPVTAVFFLAGLLLSLWRWRQPAHGLLLIWFFAGTAPAMLAPPAASLTHTIAAQPAAFILLAWGVCTVAGWLWQRHRPGGRLLPAAVVLYGVAVSGEAYFHQWANAPEVRELYQGGITAVADAVVAEPPLGPVAIGAPFISYWQPWNAVNFDLAVPADVSQVRWFNPAGAWVWPTGSELATYYFPADPLGPQIYEPELLALFEANAQPLATTSADYVAYRLADLAWLDERIEVLAGATAVQWPPDQTQLPAPALPLMFGRRLSLLAVSTPAIAADVTIRIVTYWQVLEADPTPLVAFVHVTGDGLDIWGQQDWLDVRMAGLQSGDRFAQVHIVPINPDTPAGRYQMQLGLYRPDTLERLPIIAADGQLADRVFVGAVTIDE